MGGFLQKGEFRKPLSTIGGGVWDKGYVFKKGGPALMIYVDKGVEGVNFGGNFDCVICEYSLERPFNAWCNLVLVCKDIIPKYGRTRSRRFFPARGTFSPIRWILSKNFLKHLSNNFSGQSFLWNIFLKKVDSVRKHLWTKVYTIPNL